MSEYFVVHSVTMKDVIAVKNGETGATLHYIPVNPSQSLEFNHRNAVHKSLCLRAGGDGNYTPHLIVGTALAPAGLNIEGWLTMVRAGED